jgi:iron complex transport system permease protein
MRPRLILLLLAALAPASLVLALAVGSVAVDLESLWGVLVRGDDGVARTLVLELRLPRAQAAFAVGGLLALAGALLQVLLRNPLADPYVLGISGGASVGALLALLAGTASAVVGLSAFSGAIASMLLVFGVSRGTAGGLSRLLLTGVVIASGWGALISLLLVVAPTPRLQGMLFWLLGDLSNARYAGTGAVVLAIGLAIAAFHGRALNILARGESVAAALGENPARLRALVYGLASLLTAAAVTLAGSIGFVGLIVPHLLRLLGLTDHRLLLPAAVLLGGSLLVVADTLARSIVAPIQLPVGVLTALIGVPVFLFLLSRTRAAGGYA